MLTSFYLYEKSREVCIRARPPSASLAIRGQVTKHTTVKWPIFVCLKNNYTTSPSFLFKQNSVSVEELWADTCSCRSKIGCSLDKYLSEKQSFEGKYATVSVTSNFQGAAIRPI